MRAEKGLVSIYLAKKHGAIGPGSIYLTGIQAVDLTRRKVAFEKGATAFAVIDEMSKLDGNLARSKNANVSSAR